MSTPSSTQYFEAIHTDPNTPTDPNLFNAAEIVAGSFDSAAVSTATSKAVSTVNAAAPDSTSISQANSRAVSAAAVGSAADSKTVSGSLNTSIADSKALSVSVLCSTADSKGVSVATSVPILTVVANSQNLSTADSKAVSVATATAPPVRAGATSLTSQLTNGQVYNVKDQGAVGNGTTDDYTNIAAIQALAVAAGYPLFFPPGTYRIASNLTNAINNTMIFAAGAKLSIDSGKTFTNNGYIQAFLSRIFSGSGTVAGRFQNQYLYPEWWGAVGQVGDSASGDSTATATTTALNACASLLVDQTMVFHGEYVVNGTFNPPDTSFTLMGTSPTGCGLRCATTYVAGDLFVITGISGPGNLITNLQAIGAFGIQNTGKGFNMNLSNGLQIYGCWARGMGVGFRVNGSFNMGTDCTVESCGVGLQFDTTAPEESQWKGLTFYNNTTDVYINNIEGRGTVITGSTHIGTGSAGGGDAYLITGANSKNWTVDTVQHSPGGAFTNSTTIHLAGGCSKNRITGVTVNSVGLTVAAANVFLENCSDCRVEQIAIDGASVRGIYYGSGARNTVKGVRINGAAIGVDFDGSGVENILDDADVRSCTTGLRLACDGQELRNCKFLTNTTDGTNPIAVGLLYVHGYLLMTNYGNFKQDGAGTAGKINAIAYRDHEGRKVMIGTAAPTSAVTVYAVGDRVSQRTPVVGQPKGWVCTVAGTPGTWVSEGNL